MKISNVFDGFWKYARKNLKKSGRKFLMIETNCG
jgi:hypothetical protein